MPPEVAGRPLLPQTAPMQSFTFAPPTLAPRENQRSECLFALRSAEAPTRLTDDASQTMSLSTSTTDTSV